MSLANFVVQMDQKRGRDKTGLRYVMEGEILVLYYVEILN